MFDLYHPIHLLPYVLAGVAWWCYRRWGVARWPRWRVAVNTVAWIFLLRLILADNPAVYGAYWHAIDPPEDASHFASSIASLRSDEFYPALGPTPWLVLGSSQSGAIYRPDFRGETLRVLTYAGMQPAEYPFMEEVIDRFDPETVLLYLSTFDLSSRVATEALPLVPGSLTQLDDAWWLYRTYEPESPLAIMRCVAAWSLVEYQHQEIFKGARDALLGAYDAFHHFDAVGAASDYWDRQHAFIEMSGEAYIAGHMAMLEAFVEQHRDRRIIILEGHYHPDLYALQGDLHAQVRSALEGLAAAHEHVLFVGIEALYPLSAEDYYDGYHVHDASGRAFVEHLFKHVLDAPVP